MTRNCKIVNETSNGTGIRRKLFAYLVFHQTNELVPSNMWLKLYCNHMHVYFLKPSGLMYTFLNIASFVQVHMGLIICSQYYRSIMNIIEKIVSL